MSALLAKTNLTKKNEVITAIKEKTATKLPKLSDQLKRFFFELLDFLETRRRADFFFIYLQYTHLQAKKPTPDKKSKCYTEKMKKENSSPTALRDALALTRTIMSNERTLLSYIRTGIAFIIAGAGTLRFIKDGIYVLLGGWGLIIIGVGFFLFGKTRYQALKNEIKNLNKNKKEKNDGRF